ncbi:MAG: hypothetical protein FWG29_11080, partial [Treponema sp.]|nr:hypothetical protein [Treponema sp.]
RRDVEQSLVQGIVSCVVATSSLELGLDIGDIDEVILAGTPSSCTRTLQRIGRSGHGVGETSRGFLLPFHGMDLLLGAVMAGATAEREIEKTQPIKNPLDILSQTILALCTEEIFTSDDLYKVIRTFNVFSDMSRSSFDSVIAMLVGKYFPVLQKTKTPAKDANSVHDSIRLRELKPRLYQDIDGKLYPAEGTLAMLYSSGGVIPGRGLYSMRLSDGTKIGELDEEFVFERRTGDSFDFGARSWSIVEIGNEAIIVKPLNDAADFQPFWKADSSFRSTEICQRALNYFGEYNKNASLANRDCLSKDAITALENFLYRQQEAQGGIPLPDQKIIPVEIINDPSIRPDSFQIVFHSFRGGAVHYPLAMALSSIIEEKTGMRCEAVPDDNAVLLLLPRLSVQTYSGHSDPLPLIKDCINLLGSAGEKYFKTRLEASGIFGAAFREAAERSMILPRGMYGRRIPLWVVRQRAKRLFDRVASFGDFPVTTEAWRSCLADQFDMEGFRTLLDDIATGSVELKFFQKAGASPFAHDLSWKEINNFMYEYDERKDILGKVNTKSGIADKAISDALNNPLLRPMLKTNTVESFTARQRRELPGYAPENSQSLSQWVKDRIAIPLTDEWETLTTALPDELQQQLSEDPSLGNRLSTITLPGASMPIVTHAETSVLFEASTQASELLVHLSEWLCFEGPVVASKITEVFGCTVAEAEDALDSLVDTGELVKDVKLENCEETYYCNTENFELLLRLTRKKSRPQIKEQPASFLVPFIAMRQGLIAKTESNDNSFFDLETIPLSCYPAPVQLWETELFPARIPHYKPDKLDKMLENGQLIWFGAGNKMAAFSNPSELELTTIFDSDNMQNNTDSELCSLIIKICSSYRNYWEIKDTLENELKKSFSNNEIITVLWNAVWQSKLSSDTWESIRQGIDLGFTPETTGTNNNNSVPISKLPGIVPPYRNSHNIRERRLPHALKGKWRDGSPVPGRWFAMDTGYQNDQESGKPDVFEQLSSLEQDELNRDRVRLLLQRWGILCRPLLEMEGFFSWSQLLPAMRRMELSGELVTGRFFEGIPSLQFAVPSIALELEAAVSETAGDRAAPVYWMNAADPASPAGWNITGLDPRYPSRNSSSRMCFRGNDLAAVSCKNGRELNVFVKEDDPDINRVFAFLVFPRHRACHPAKNIALEIINGKPAAESPYAGILTEMGFISDRGKLLLW